jgi:hypothetical protein
MVDISVRVFQRPDATFLERRHATIEAISTMDFRNVAS